MSGTQDSNHESPQNTDHTPFQVTNTNSNNNNNGSSARAATATAAEVNPYVAQILLNMPPPVKASTAEVPITEENREEKVRRRKWREDREKELEEKQKEFDKMATAVQSMLETEPKKKAPSTLV